MNMNMRQLSQSIIFLIFTLLFTQAFASDPANKEFYQLADEYFDTLLLPENPTLAVSLGVHQFDAHLENFGKPNFAIYASQLQKFADRVKAVKPDQLNEEAQGDRELILNNIYSQLLTLQTIRPWEKNPDFYSSELTVAAFVLMSRPFAPANERLKSLIAREKLMPRMLVDARSNLVNPPKIYTEIAIEQMPGIIAFFQNDVPKAFKDATDENLKKEFAATNAEVIAALQSYQQWLQKDLLPRSHGDFRFGADTFSKKLQYDEMVDIPLPRLLAIGQENLKQNQLAYAKLKQDLAKTAATTAGKVDSHPAPDKLLSSFSNTFSDLIRFIKHRNIITIPSDVRPTMEETPPFMRATTFASMDTPGPFEKHANQAFFNVTLPDASWSAAKVNDYMSEFTYPVIKGTAIHETYPGHYVQFLWMHNVKSRVRKILGCMSNAEGWAHYAEQMMVDEGYGISKTERETKLMRLGQLQGALMRNARYIVAIQMHTGNMTFDQAVNFFVKEGKLSRTAAVMEAKRGTADATYLIYTLGKLQIQKLRADMEAKEGEQFNLRQFHDDFMKQGYPPIKIVRRAMMKDNSPTL